jgi:hypothetical protein
MEKARRKIFVAGILSLLILCGSALAVDSNGLVGHWEFDEGEGSIAYDSAGDNDGTLVNGPAWTTGILDGALSFDGSDDYVEVDDSATLDITSEITIVAWVKRDATGIRHDIVAKNTNVGPYNGYLLVLNESNRISLSLTISNSWEQCQGGSVDDTNWHHLAGTFDGNEMVAYIDGSPVAQNTASGSIAVNDNNLYIGRSDPTAALNFFDGKLDDVRIYDRALSAEEVKHAYLNGLGAQFVDAEGDDYHLKSEGWRWAGDEAWMWDDVTSPCVGSGNPGTPLGDEPESIPRDPDNIWGVNIRANMGAYGGTSQASMGPHGWALLADLNNDGIVDWLDVGLYAQCWLSADYEPAGDLNRDGTVDMLDWALLGQDWTQQTIWR